MGANKYHCEKACQRLTSRRRRLEPVEQGSPAAELTQDPCTALQASPAPRAAARSTKLQTSNFREASSSKRHDHEDRKVILCPLRSAASGAGRFAQGSWSLPVGASLEFGVWSLEHRRLGRTLAIILLGFVIPTLPLLRSNLLTPARFPTD